MTPFHIRCSENACILVPGWITLVSAEVQEQLSLPHVRSQVQSPPVSQSLRAPQRNNAKHSSTNTRIIIFT
jgi:hypothetical protein